MKLSIHALAATALLALAGCQAQQAETNNASSNGTIENGILPIDNGMNAMGADNGAAMMTTNNVDAGAKPQ
jgi:hypothetical protein